MKNYADKMQKNQCNSMAIDRSGKQCVNDSIFQFLGNRPDALAQRKLQEMANNSPRTMRLNAIKEIANNKTGQPRAMVANQNKSTVQRNEHQVIQMTWGSDEEAKAQEKLGPMHNKVYKVPTWNVLDQQAWAGLGNKGKVVQWGKNKFRDVLQPIDADKVVKRASEILEKKVTVKPPPVAFSTETVADADPMSGELILLDSHHTVNAARILQGDATIEVLHNAKPDLKGNDTIAKIAESRSVITKNKNIAKKYNQGDLGWAAYEEAYREILKINEDGNAPMKRRREKGG